MKVLMGNEEFAQTVFHGRVSVWDWAVDSLKTSIEIFVEAVVDFGLDFLVQGFEEVELGAVYFAIFEFQRLVFVFVKLNGINVDVFETVL
jgi:hypothetical protein